MFTEPETESRGLQDGAGKVHLQCVLQGAWFYMFFSTSFSRPQIICLDTQSHPVNEHR